jgi:hypothetical protein
MLKAVTASAQGTIAKTSGTLALKYPPPQPLDTINVNFQFMQQGSKAFTLTILPDITALDISQAKGIILEDTTVKIKVANRTDLQVLGTAEAKISRHGNHADELIYIAKDLSEPLLSRNMLKGLGLLHPNWPHQNCAKIIVTEQGNTWERKEPSKNPSAAKPVQVEKVEWNVKDKINLFNKAAQSHEPSQHEGHHEQDNTESAVSLLNPNADAKFQPLVTRPLFDAIANKYSQTVFFLKNVLQ